MEVLLFDKQKYDLLYNCSFYDIDKIPVESRRHPYWGVFFLSLYSTCFFLYIVCMIAMLTMEQRKQASYQFMILLGCSHLIGLQTSGLMVGIGTLKGIAHGSHRRRQVKSSVSIDVLFCTNDILPKPFSVVGV
ncbi:hypothetical protein M3Y94_00014100 [Aphelenchoides besseyi]|nr:hypothetical protein M3Y94_00014100 [Aphelenchoides besseyi]